MIEPATGRMTVIDFDLMIGVNDLIEIPIPAQWNSPPETVFWDVDNVFSMDPQIDSHEDPEGAKNQEEKQNFAGELIKHNIFSRVKIFRIYSSIIPAYRDKDAFMEALGTWFTDWFVAAKDMKNPDGSPITDTEMQIYFKRLSTDTFDSFCVAFSIMYFLDKVFPGYHTTAGPLKNLYDTVLVPMIDFNPQTRMRVDRALTEIDTIIAALLAAGGWRKTRKAKKSRRSASRRYHNSRKSRSPYTRRRNAK
jgi:hypothetical protein